MDKYNSAYDAARRGESWSSVTNKFGNSYEVRNGFDRGSSVNSQFNSDSDSSHKPFAEGLGGGLIFIWMIAVMTLICFGILYSPFLIVGFILLFPFFLNINFSRIDNEGVVVYGVFMVIIAYLLSCVYEYYRARMISARNNNHKWELSFIILFTIRIIVPGIATSMFLFLSNNHNLSEIGLSKTLYILLESLLGLPTIFMIWKFKVLQPKDSFFLTEWAFNKGLLSMADTPFRDAPEIGILALKTEKQYKYYYITWLLIATFIGCNGHIVFSILSLVSFDLITIPHKYIYIISFAIAGWPAKLFLDNISTLFLKVNLSEKLQISLSSLIKICCISIIPIWLGFIDHYHYWSLLFTFLIIGGVQIFIKLRKINKKSEYTLEQSVQ